MSNSKLEKPIEKPNDTTWTWTLFATAVGAGVLYLPVNAGINGVWPLIVVALISLPMIYLSHRNLSRVVLAATPGSTNINDIIFDNFSPRFCNLFAFCYFLAVYPMIIIYSVGLTKTINSVLTNVFFIDYIPRYLLSLIILLVFLIIIITKENLIRRITKFIALPLAAILLLLSIYLIQYWNFEYLKITPSSFDFFETLWLTIPAVIFTFNHSPSISTFSLDYMRHYDNPEEQTTKILWRTSLILFAFIMLFVFSCVLSIDPKNMEIAKQSDTNVLIYMSNYFDDPVLHYINPLVAIIAMSGAFLGTFFGARESIVGLIEQKLHRHKISSKKLDNIAILLLFIPSYIACILDVNVGQIISILSGPIIALLLFIFPIYAIYNIKSLEKYRKSLRDKLTNIFIFIIGITSFSAILYSFKDIIHFIR